MSRWTIVVAVCAAWIAAARAEVEIPPGFEIVDVIVTDDFIHWPAMNDCGQIAYSQRINDDGWMQEIFLYENGHIVRVTDNDVLDESVRINNRGDIFWMRGVRSLNRHQVILYRDGVETLLQDGEFTATGGALNNLGEAVWARFDDARCPIRSWLYVFDGENISELVADSQFMNQGCDINDAGWMVWMHTDFCVSPWAGTIQLYRDGQILDLPSSETQVQGSRINNLGQIVWDAQSDLELWQDGETVTLLDSDDASVVDIGDTGDIYFARTDFSRGKRAAWLYRSQARRPRFYRLTDDDVSASRGSVNAWGEVAWVDYRDPAHGDLRSGIRLMRRIRTGDSDFDGEVDLRDYRALARHLTGPVRTDGLCEQRFLDTNYDGDLDLEDFARLQNGFAP